INPKTFLFFRNQFHLSTQSRAINWVIVNDDGWQSPHSSFYIVLPDVPNENPENNLLLESFESNHDWPPISSGLPEEFYQGAVKYILEMGANFAEHLDMLEEELKNKDASFTFEKVLSPLLKDEGNAYLAISSVQLKMLTDWPECNILDWEKDFDAITSLFISEMADRSSHQIIVDSVKRIPESDLAKLDPWKRRLVEILKMEWNMHGFQPDPTNNKHDRKEQNYVKGLFHEIRTYGRRYLACILCDPRHANVQVSVRDRSQLKHVPPKLLKKLANGNDPEKGPWKASTDSSSMFDLLKYSNAREQKKELWDAWIARSRISQHIGFKSTAHHQLSTKMIGNPETLRDFIAGLYYRFRPVIIDRYEQWSKYAEKEEGIKLPFGQLRTSDLFYVCRREAEHFHSVDMLDVMNYFPAWPTFEKILALTKRIMGIDFKEISSNNSLERCHPSVRIFEVTDKTSSEHLGRFYVDVFSREGKIDWGWQTNIWRLKDETKGLDKLIWMVGNLEEDEYLHYEELEKLLETFGNAIQLFLTRSPYMQLTIPHVMYSYEWDAKDFLKSFFKFFLSKPDMLMTMSSQHLKTGQLLSPEKAKNISHALARGNFWDTWRTLFWADYDLSLFELEKFQDKYYLDLYKEVYAEYFPFPIEHNNFHPCSFIPIFVPHSMPCMYYRKLWCETLALDVHQTFDNEGDTLSTANRLKEIWLNNGALKSQWEMYTQFQGREPNVLAISNYYDPILTPLLNEDKKVAIGC
ncbi:Peptidase_M3 domain-containing protein, partial [Meloidogyne graminicola]